MRRLIHAFIRRRALARHEIDEELRSHLDARIEHLIDRGMAPEVARDEALRRFGDLESARAALHAQALTGRRLSTGDYLHDFADDLRYVARGLARSPAFTAGVVATLALGLGVNAAVFRVADFVLFRAPSGVANAGTLRWVESSTTIGGGSPLTSTTFSFPAATRLVDSHAFSMASMYAAPRAAQGRDGADIGVAYVDGAFFQLLGVHAWAGRTFDAIEGTPGSGRAVAVASFDYWQRKLGAAPLDARSTVRVGTRDYTLIGIAARGFAGIDVDPVDVWLPLGPSDFGHAIVDGVTIPWYQSEMVRPMRVIGRLSPAVTDATVTPRLAAVAGSPDDDANQIQRKVALHPIVPIGGTAKNQEPNKLLVQLTIIAAIVLIIACANVVNLLLARGLRRHHEIAIRLAIGASRARVSRLLVDESVVLAILGGGAAALFGQWTSEALRRLLFPDARWTTIAFDRRTLVFTAVLALVAGVGAGLAPALQSTTPDLVSGLKSGRIRGGSKTRATRTALIVLQTALSLALLVASGLLVRSLMRLYAVNLGFDPKGLVTGSVGAVFFEPGAPHVDTDALAARLRAMPGTRGVALSSVVPFGATASLTITVPGSPYVPESDRDAPQSAAVSANYFSVMGTRVIDGRGFTEADVSNSEPVALVNASMARHYFPAGIPPGSCVHPVGRPCARIVGTVEDIRDTPAGGPAPMRFYLALTQWTNAPSGVIVRTSPEGAPLVAAALKSAIPPGQRGITEIVIDRVNRALRPWHTATWLFAGFGIVALALACIGVYSVMSYIASERLHELGIRVVLGATSGDVLRLVLFEGMRLTLLGGAIGVMVAAAAGRLLASLLFDVSPLDPLVYVLGVVCLVAATAGAVMPPALGASRVDPIAAFRTE